ncbi:MAG TPA: chemotaxis protein CheW [Kofleriaceae bacterium]|nr:chemotaxis protein CheW [Kofleriaceae bacterium]
MPVQLSTVWVAVGATHLQEVRGSLSWVSLPGAPPHLPGVVPWRGRAIAVLDLGGLLGVAPPVQPGDARSRTLIAQVDATAFAIPVDMVREVHTVTEVQDNHATQVRLAHGQVLIGGLVMPLIDLSVALASIAHAEAEAR